MLTKGNLLKEILVDYRALGEFLRQERRAILSEKIEKLGSVLAKSNLLIRGIEEKTGALQKGVEPDSSIPDREKQKTQIVQQIRELLTISQQNEELMAEKRQKAGREIGRIRTGQKLIRAYQSTGAMFPRF